MDLPTDVRAAAAVLAHNVLNWRAPAARWDAEAKAALIARIEEFAREVSVPGASAPVRAPQPSVEPDEDGMPSLFG